MSKKPGSIIKAEYFLFRAVFGFLQFLPEPIAVAFSKTLALLLYSLIPSFRRVGLRNLDIAFPDLPLSEKKRILRKSFSNLGRMLAEISQFQKLDKSDFAKKIIFDFDNEALELYEKVKRGETGVLIVTAHLGNWELFVYSFAALFQPMSYLARPLDNPLLEEFTSRLRSRFGNQPINKRNSLLKAASILKKGQILGLLADINTHPKEAVFVPFFNQLAATSSGPALLALRAGSPLVPLFCVYDENERIYKVIRGSIIYPDSTLTDKEQIKYLTRLYTAEIEKVVRKFPEQWVWIHRRWKTRPPGEPPLY